MSEKNGRDPLYTFELKKVPSSRVKRCPSITSTTCVKHDIMESMQYEDTTRRA